MRLRHDEGGQALVFAALGNDGWESPSWGWPLTWVLFGVRAATRRSLPMLLPSRPRLITNTTTRPPRLKTAGQAAATANGITNGVGGATVTINAPPVYGPYAGGSGFIEAIVYDPSPTVFMGMLTKVKVLQRRRPGRLPALVPTLGAYGHWRNRAQTFR